MALCAPASSNSSSVTADSSTVGTKNSGFYKAARAGVSVPVVAPLALERDFDLVVVGGGIIGLAIAREALTRNPTLRVAVLEKEGEVAAHQTGHNSGVIHAGMYYEPGSAMARTCVRGAALMYAYCAAKGLPVDRCGKLIVATDANEGKAVDELYRRGTANGVQGLQVLSGAEVAAREPAVSRAFSALWSPNTGVVDYGLVSRALAADILATGRGDVKLGFELTAVEDGTGADAGRVVLRGTEPGQAGPPKRVTARHVITAAGFYADRVAALAGGAPHPKIVTFRGTYYQMKDGAGSAGKDIVRTNVYPVPTGGGIPVGVHFTPTVNERRGHQMIIGPGACITFSREGYRMLDISPRDLFDFATNGHLWAFIVRNPLFSLAELWKDVNRAAFLRDAQKLVPSLTADMVEESFTGVMAQVFEADGTAAKDYIFERGCMGGRVMHLRNAPSPACTASLAIAETVVDLAAKDFGWTAGQ